MRSRTGQCSLCCKYNQALITGGTGNVAFPNPNTWIGCFRYSKTGLINRVPPSFSPSTLSVLKLTSRRSSASVNVTSSRCACAVRCRKFIRPEVIARRLPAAVVEPPRARRRPNTSGYWNRSRPDPALRRPPPPTFACRPRPETWSSVCSAARSACCTAQVSPTSARSSGAGRDAGVDGL